MHKVATGIADAAVDFIENIHEDNKSGVSSSGETGQQHRQSQGQHAFSRPVTGDGGLQELETQHGRFAGIAAGGADVQQRAGTAEEGFELAKNAQQRAPVVGRRPASSMQRVMLSSQHRDAAMKSLEQALAIPQSRISSKRASRHGSMASHDGYESDASEQSVIAPEILEQLSEDEIQILLKAALQGGNFFDAKQLCMQRLERFGKTVDAHAQFCQILLKAGEPRSAMEHAEAAIAIDENVPKGWLVKACACRALGQVSETFSAMMQCERLVARRTAELGPRFHLAMEDTRAEREARVKNERKRQRRLLRSAPDVPTEQQLYREPPWHPPDQCEALKRLQGMLQDIELKCMQISKETPGLISKLSTNLNNLGPRWWLLTKEDEDDPELLLPPPSKERSELLDQILCQDLDSLLLAACIGAGPFLDASGKLQKESKRLMCNLILNEGAAVLVREQMLQRVIMKNAGANLLPHLQTSKWAPSFKSPAQLHAVASVSAMAAFQHLFELHARAMAPLLRRPLNPEWLRNILGEDAEPWRHAVFMLKPWLELHGHRLFNGKTHLFLHNILASVVQTKLTEFKRVNASYAPEHDTHAFLFHIIKICSCKGVEAFFRRLAHPTGVAWLWDGYFSRMQVYQSAYGELHREKETHAKEASELQKSSSLHSVMSAKKLVGRRQSFRERFRSSTKKSFKKLLDSGDACEVGEKEESRPLTSSSNDPKRPSFRESFNERRNKKSNTLSISVDFEDLTPFAEHANGALEEQQPMTATAVGSRSSRIEGRMRHGVVGWGDGSEMNAGHLTSTSIRDKIDKTPEAQYQMGMFRNPDSPRGANRSKLASNLARPMTSPALGVQSLLDPGSPKTPATPATPGGTILSLTGSFRRSPSSRGAGRLMTPEPSPAGGKDAALRSALWSFQLAGVQRANRRLGGTPVADHIQKAAIAFRHSAKKIRLPSEDKSPVTNWWDPQAPHK